MVKKKDPMEKTVILVLMELLMPMLIDPTVQNARVIMLKHLKVVATSVLMVNW
jgi:hypothetical protein